MRIERNRNIARKQQYARVKASLLRWQKEVR